MNYIININSVKYIQSNSKLNDKNKSKEAFVLILFFQNNFLQALLDC